jgi:hypothetical protein
MKSALEAAGAAELPRIQQLPRARLAGCSSERACFRKGVVMDQGEAYWPLSSWPCHGKLLPLNLNTQAPPPCLTYFRRPDTGTSQALP